MTRTGAGTADGSSLANALANTITYGAGAGKLSRGDNLHLCGTEAAPITFNLNPSGIGAFDGTVNADSDIVEIDGLASKCGGTQGVWAGGTGTAILLSGILAVHVHHLTLHDVPSNGVNNLFGTNTCAITPSYPCGCSYIHDITGYSIGGSMVGQQTSANTTFPSANIPGVCATDNVATDIGASCVRKRLNTDSYVQERNKCTRAASASNTWPLYGSGVVLGCLGVCDWTRVGGAGTFVYKADQTTAGATSGAVPIGVDIVATVHGSKTKLLLADKDAACVDDASCLSNVSTTEWGLVGDVVYVNRGDALCVAASSCPDANAAIDIVYARATNSVARKFEIYDPSPAFDGNGCCFDFGEDYSVAEGGYVSGAPSYSVSVGRGNTGSIVRGIVSRNAGLAAVNVNNEASVYNITSSGSPLAVQARTATGETVTVKNVLAPGLASVSNDAFGDGTVSESCNSTTSTPGFVSASPTVIGGFKLTAASSARYAGCDMNVGAYPDAMGRSFSHPPSIGGMEAASGDAAATRSIATRQAATSRAAATSRSIR